MLSAFSLVAVSRSLTFRRLDITYKMISEVNTKAKHLRLMASAKASLNGLARVTLNMGNWKTWIF